MKIENQVCTLEQAKRLVVLGVYCPSAFVYFTTGVHSGIALGNMYMRHIWILTGNAYEEKEVNITPAYTVAELGEMLPDLIEREDKQYELVCIKEDDCWLCRYVRNNNMLDCFHYAAGETEAEARTNMLEYCIESNLTTIDQINKSITQ